METITTKSERHFLGNYFEKDSSASQSVKALMFGQLADLAWPIVNNYRSDLFHDAMWIEEFAGKPCTFYFAADDCGTSIGTDLKLVALRSPDNNVWKIELQNKDGAWYLWITPESKKI
jgi:hypothetical protein